MSRLLAWRRRPKMGGERGSNLIEMAIIATILLSMVAGAVDLGGAYQHYIIMLNASREGARQYARMPCKADNRFALRNAVISATTEEAEYSNLALSSSNVEMEPDPASTCPETGHPVVVTVDVDYKTSLASIIGFEQIPLRASTSMIFFGKDDAGETEH